MTNDKPVEPSAIFDANGTPVGYGQKPSQFPDAVGHRSLLPTLVRAAAAGPLLTTAAWLATGAAAIKVAEMASRMIGQSAMGAMDVTRVRHGAPSGVEISWSHVEIRWPV